MKVPLKKLIKPGKKIRVYYGKGHHANVLYHIRAIVDEHYVVVKSWVKHKKRWSYEVHPMFWFEMLQEQGLLYKPKQKVGK